MALVDALDQHTQHPKQLGENGTVEYGWSENIREEIVQFYFQLVRTKDTRTLEKKLDSILITLKKQYQSNKLNNTNQANEAKECLSLMYKILSNTRDIVEGKGEYNLTYMQIYVWYERFPELALYAIDKLVQLSDTNPYLVDYVNEEHAYGSWKDIKYLCNYVYEKTQNKKHPLIVHSIHRIIDTLRHDYDIFHKKQPISLAAKWCPREKGKYSWLYKEIVYHSYKHYFDTAPDSDSRFKAYKKASREFRFSLSTLNKYIDTVQVKMCDKQWAYIDFNKVTSITMRKNKMAFTNKTKQKTQRSAETDRIQCAENLTKHVQRVIENSKKPDDDVTKTNDKIHGKRAGVYELVKDALNITTSEESKDTDEYKIINLQWADNSKQNKPLGNIIPMTDTSPSMGCDAFVPLFNSIGLSIRLSEIVAPEFRDRIMTFSEKPTWVNLSDCDDFVTKVHKVSVSDWGMNTNFYAAMKMILDVIVEHNMSPKSVEDLVLAVFSDMQFDEASTTKKNKQDTMYETIEKMYYDAGMKTTHAKPYKVPHILFWNLRSTNGFPTLSTQKNVTMLSGYSPVLLNAFYNKGMEAIREYNPYKMIKEILSSERYDVMENKVNTILHL